jgi:histidinol-phosphate aminotransferase
MNSLKYNHDEFYTDVIANYGADYSPSIKYKYDFSNAENPLGASPLVHDAIVSHLNKVSSYPAPYADDAVKVFEEHFRLVDRDFRVLMTAGAAAALNLVVTSLLNPGQHIVMPKASFPVPMFAASIAHGYGRMVNMDGANQNIDLAALSDSIDENTAFVFICNPNNPTGELINIDTLVSFAKSLPCPLVVSEANAEYANVTLLDHDDLPRNLLIVKSFSKIHGLAGMRVGALCVHKDLYASIKSSHCPFTVSNLANVAAIAALDDKLHVAKSYAYMTAQREYISHSLRQNGFNVIPSMANVMCIETPKKFKTTNDFIEALNAKNISVVNGADFCEGLSRFIRISPRSADHNKYLIEQLIDMVKV